MGQILKPTCKCNTEFEELLVGFGFNYLENNIANQPTPCFNCKKVFVRNINNEKLKCPNNKCRRKVEPYGKFVETEDGMEYVLDEKNKCPVCLEVELTFEPVGMWD